MNLKVRSQKLLAEIIEFRRAIENTRSSNHVHVSIAVSTWWKIEQRVEDLQQHNDRLTDAVTRARQRYEQRVWTRLSPKVGDILYAHSRIATMDESIPWGPGMRVTKVDNKNKIVYTKKHDASGTLKLDVDDIAFFEITREVCPRALAEFLRTGQPLLRHYYDDEEGN